MKRVKIMLMSLTILAIVGGALAFKAKYTDVPLCSTSIELYSTDVETSTSCTILADWTTTAGPVVTSYYTTEPVGGDCYKGPSNNIPLPCANSTYLIHE